MKNFFCRKRSIFCTLFLVVFFAWTAAAEIPEKRTIRVGIYENAPKIFTTETGQPAGIFVDIIENIAANEGWRLHYIRGTWAEGLERLAKGQIDIMPDVARSIDREKLFSFHEVPVFSSWTQVYARKGAKIASILDLHGKKVLVLDGSVQQERFARLAEGFGLDITLTAMPDYQTMFAVVAGGEADALITNRFYGLLHAKAGGLENTAVMFDPSDLFFAAPLHGHKVILQTIDRHLINLKKDARSNYYASIQRWTADKVEFKLPFWLKMLGLSGLGFLIISLIGSMIMKHQVDAATWKLRQINQQMEQRIAERTAELAATMEKAQAADRLKSTFLATMSHELRTPLNSIIGFTGIMLQGLAGSLNDEQQKQMGMVQKSSRHLLALINDVLDISKIEAGHLLLGRDSFALRVSIEKIVKMVLPLAEQKGIELAMDIAPNVGIIDTDQRRLEQVLVNLLNNAVKFTEKGHVRISCRNKKNCSIIVVSDSGIGIQLDELASIFQPFHQIDTGLARKREGTGLGLFISKKIIDLMHGSIEVTSMCTQGSTFTVRIPRQTGVVS